jgi:hypothetical protein
MNILFNRLVARDEDKPMEPVAPKQFWETHFDERQRKEIAYCVIYADSFGHGTDGHNIRLIVAKMAQLLENATKGNKPEAVANDSTSD